MSTNVFIDQVLMMQAFGQTVATGLQNESMASLYLKLMCEEMGETLIAANPTARDSIEHLIRQLSKLAVVGPGHDKVEMFDGANDVLVTTAGFGLSMGFPMQEGWDEVWKTNMAKVDPTTGKVRRREDGKVLKPDGWVKPDLARVLRES